MICLFGIECFLLAFIALLGLLGFLFWVWMLVDCATNEPSEGNNKVVWILVIVLLHFLGALIYFIFRRPQRIQEQGV
jgi:cytochrome c oxidase assembly factor CtaG